MLPLPLTSDCTTVFSEAQLPYHRNEPMHLRHVLSHTQWLQSATAQANRASSASMRDKATASDNSKTPGRSGIVGNLVTLKPNKSVSFAKVENILSK